MTARSRPEDIEYISRLKFGSQFSYTPEHHTTEDVIVENYFHNIAKRWFEVISISADTTIVEPVENWRHYNLPKKAKPAPIKKAA